MTTRVDWIAADWGTSNVRVWGMAADGTQVSFAESGDGMARLQPGDYPGVLENLVADQSMASHGVTDVMICGMAGARQGWREAPYLETPADLDALGARAVTPEMRGNGLRPRILPGVCQRGEGREDVMRGEETQVLGLLALKPHFEGIVVMPGTHCKWVRVANNAIANFTTTMTGEMFDVMRKHSVLHHSLPDEPGGEGEEAGISDGLEKGLAEPGLLGGNLFRIRAAALLSGKSAPWCAGYLSGLLIGSEIGGRRDWFGEGPIQLVGRDRLSAIYAKALTRLGIRSEFVDATLATIAGLTAARGQIQ